MSSEKSSEAPEKPSKRASEEGSLEPGPTAKAPRQEMTAELGGLTETLTLKILSELDFQSLGAVEGVSRRLRRVARDKRLFDRVSVVRWGSSRPSPRPFGTKQSSTTLLRTNCARLGAIRVSGGEAESDGEEDADESDESGDDEPVGGEAAAAKFLVILERLLAGGAALVSLETPDGLGGWHLNGLPALLTKHSVRLRALSFWGEEEILMKMLRSQPQLQHLSIQRLPWEEDAMPEFAESLPSLLHLDLSRGSGLDRELWEKPNYALGLGKLAGKLRSLVVLESRSVVGGERLEVLGEASGGKLLFRGASPVDHQRLEKEQDHNDDFQDVLEKVNNLVLDTSALYFAVEDFQREERGGHFLCAYSGEPRDVWDELHYPAAQPTLHRHPILAFLERIAAEVTDEERGEQEPDWDEGQDEDYGFELEPREPSDEEDSYDEEASSDE